MSLAVDVTKPGHVSAGTVPVKVTNQPLKITWKSVDFTQVMAMFSDSSEFRTLFQNTEISTLNVSMATESIVFKQIPQTGLDLLRSLTWMS